MDEWTLSSIIFPFSYCCVVNLRLSAFAKLSVSAATASHPLSSRCPGYKLGVGGVVAAPGVRLSPGLCSSKNTQGSHNFFLFFSASFNPPSPRSSRGGPADSWPAALLSARLFLAARSHLLASDTAASQVISLLFTLSSQSRTGARTVTSPPSRLFFFRIKPKGRERCLLGFIRPLRLRHWYTYLSSPSVLFLFHPSVCSL